MESLKSFLEIPTMEGWKRYGLVELEPKIYCLEKLEYYESLASILKNFTAILQVKKVSSYAELITKHKINIPSLNDFKSRPKKLESLTDQKISKKNFKILPSSTIKIDISESNDFPNNESQRPKQNIIKFGAKNSSVTMKDFYTKNLANEEKLIHEQNNVYTTTILEQLHLLNKKLDVFRVEANISDGLPPNSTQHLPFAHTITDPKSLSKPRTAKLLHQDFLRKTLTSKTHKNTPKAPPQPQLQEASNFCENSNLMLYNSNLRSRNEFEKNLVERICNRLRHKKLYHPITGDIIYEGEVVNGKREGRGKEIIFNRIAWIGKFSNDYFSGMYQVGLEDNGKVRYKGGILSFKKSRGKHGFGISYYLNGQISFIGGYFEGIPEGDDGACFTAGGTHFNTDMDTEGSNEGGIMM